MHVVCSLPNAGDVINGVVFVPMMINGEEVRVSEDVNPNVAKTSFLSIPGYSEFTGDKKVVEDMIASFRMRHAEQVIQAPSLELERTVRELQDSNKRLSGDLVAARSERDTLKEQVKGLQAFIGQPSLDWTKQQLLSFAQMLNLEVTTAMNKEDLLAAINEHGSGQEKTPPVPGDSPDKGEETPSADGAQ